MATTIVPDPLLSFWHCCCAGWFDPGGPLWVENRSMRSSGCRGHCYCCCLRRACFSNSLSYRPSTPPRWVSPDSRPPCSSPGFWRESTGHCLSGFVSGIEVIDLTLRRVYSRKDSIGKRIAIGTCWFGSLLIYWHSAVFLSDFLRLVWLMKNLTYIFFFIF